MLSNFFWFGKSWAIDPQLDGWERLMKCGTRVRRLWLPPYKCGTALTARLFDCMPVSASVLFPCVRIAHMDMAYLRTPFLSSSLVDLTIMISDPALSHMSPLSPSSMRTIAAFLPNLEKLCVEGSMSPARAQRNVLEFIAALSTLKTLVLGPSTFTSAVIRAASMLPLLERISVKECNRDDGGLACLNGGGSPLVSPLDLDPTCFRALRHFGFQTNRTVRVPRLVIQHGVPFSNLISLWVRFVDKPNISPPQVRHMLENLSTGCPRLQMLTLRLCGRTVYRGRADWLETNAVGWEDIEAILGFPLLEEFSIDDTVPLRMTLEGLHSLALGGGLFRKLWLNPYPLFGRGTDSRDMALPMESLAVLAKSCPCLQRLGLFVRADLDVSPTGSDSIARFKCLEDFSVGWSYPGKLVLLAGRLDTARFLAAVFGAGVRLVPCTGYDAASIGDWESSDMRAFGDMFGQPSRPMRNLSLMWSALWAFASFYRDYAHVL